MITKKQNEKYLKLDASGTFHLIFRVPQKFGGKLIRQSLFTKDLHVARSIRDRFVVAILTLNSGISALEKIGKSILESQDEAFNHLGKIKSIINAKENVTLQEGHEKFLSWMKKTSGYRPSTIERYSESVLYAIKILGENKNIEMLSRTDAIKIRDNLISENKNATTVNHTISIFRTFLRWLNKEGICFCPHSIENFKIELPAVRKENTAIIPPSHAD